jgi:hypothetical protein
MFRASWDSIYIFRMDFFYFCKKVTLLWVVSTSYVISFFFCVVLRFEIRTSCFLDTIPFYPHSEQPWTLGFFLFIDVSSNSFKQCFMDFIVKVIHLLVKGWFLSRLFFFDGIFFLISILDCSLFIEIQLILFVNIVSWYIAEFIYSNFCMCGIFRTFLKTFPGNKDGRNATKPILWYNTHYKTQQEQNKKRKL